MIDTVNQSIEQQNTIYNLIYYIILNKIQKITEKGENVMNKLKRGFALLELMLTVAIIGILLTIAILQIQHNHEKSLEQEQTNQPYAEHIIKDKSYPYK